MRKRRILYDSRNTYIEGAENILVDNDNYIKSVDLKRCDEI
jgi:hypothetical protein